MHQDTKLSQLIAVCKRTFADFTRYDFRLMIVILAYVIICQAQFSFMIGW